MTMAAKMIKPLSTFEDVGVEKQSLEVTHDDLIETTLSASEQKRLM